MKCVIFRDMDAHPKNRKAFRQMCKDMNITVLECQTPEQIPLDTDFIWSNNTVLFPHYVPEKSKLLFGPGFFTFPDPKHPLFYHDYRGKGVFTCLSQWIQESWKEFIDGPRIEFVPCPFPVDTEIFKPDSTKPKTLDCVLYFKHRQPSLKKEVITFLEQNGISYRLFQYGFYKEDDYKDALKIAKFAIWIGCCESQGFALQECLAMNVPIVVLNATSMFDECDQETGRIYYEKEKGVKKLLGTTVPYWDHRCGIIIHEVHELPSALRDLLTNYSRFEPRKFVLETLSSEACWTRLKRALQLE